MAVVHIIGVRGIPNRYGGFERLIEILGPHLAARGHDVTVYCEKLVDSKATEFIDPRLTSDVWNGVRRVFIPVDSRGGARATLAYDWRAFSLVPRGAVSLIFGYGTAIYQTRLCLRGVRHAVNMDGIEWQREKWGFVAKLWLRLNEFFAAKLSDALISDHPEIKQYLHEKLGADSTMIAYGVDLDRAAHAIDHDLLRKYSPLGFDLVIARPEPENQIHIILEAYKKSGMSVPLVVVGNFSGNSYGQLLCQQYPGAVFAGPIYDASVLDSLRAASRYYFHGHSVGGTNPSLIEAMAAGALVVAHDNPFNRWVLGPSAGYFFKDAGDLCRIMEDPPSVHDRELRLAAAQKSCRDRFMWSDILVQYEHIVARLEGSSRRNS